MQELFARIAANVGVPEPLAQKAVGMVLGYMQREGTDGSVVTMIESMPGAMELVAQFNGAETESSAAGSGGGMLGGLMGAASSLLGGSTGGLMALGQSLMAEGLDTGQIKGIAEETVAYARQHAGEETVDKALKAIPGLSAIL